MSSEEREKKVVSIRGVDKKLYEEIATLARETGRTVGEVINEAMKLFLTTSGKLVELGKAFAEGLKEGSENAIEVGNLDILVVDRRDLKCVDGPIVFKNIKKLVIGRDVPFELFESKVRRIVMCDEVVIPDSYPKLLVARKCYFVKKIVVEK